VSALILGPDGVLPPGEWAIGARVQIRGSDALVLGARPPTDERLDLTTGCLSHACRALLDKVRPTVRQPDNPPYFFPEFGSSQFTLIYDHHTGSGAAAHVEMGVRDHFHIDADGRIQRGADNSMRTLGLAFEGRGMSLRRALALALEAAAGE